MTIKLYSRDSGDLGVSEFSDLEFEVQRFFYVSQLPNTVRGRHRHPKDEVAYLFVMYGKVDLIMHGENQNSKTITLEAGEPGIYIPGQMCRVIRTSNQHAVWGVFSNRKYEDTSTIPCGCDV